VPAGKVLLVAVDGVTIVVDKWGRGCLELRDENAGTGGDLPRLVEGSKITVGFVSGIFKQS
jgi:hypothetical protein